MSEYSFNSQNPLLVTDLFQCILDCLITSLPQRLSKEECQTLAVLARTCRAFSEPSLNVLWQCLDSLIPLVRCFVDVVDDTIVKVPPSPLEWLAINRYSHRIHELTLGDEPLSLHFAQHAGLVLPNLRVFRWKSPAVQEFSTSPESPPKSIAFSSFLAQNLVTIDVQFGHPGDPNYLLFLETYLCLCLNLKSIRIGFDSKVQDDMTVPQALSRAICDNGSWQHVDLSPPIDSAVLKHLGACSTLKTASLAIAPQTTRPDEDCFGTADTPFRSLSDLSLVLWDTLDSATRLLRPHDQAFNAFSVTLHGKIIPTEVSALLEAVASPQRIHSLQFLNVCATGQPEVHSQPLSEETFRPLVSLAHLRRAVIEFNHPALFEDEEFEWLTPRWPLIKRLQMTWAREPGTLRSYHAGWI